MNKLKVIVLYGGQSSEHDISRLSARFILENLDRTKYDVIPCAIDRDGQWYRHEIDALLVMDGDALNVKYDGVQSCDANDLLKTAHIVFPIIHGDRYENGVLQGYFEFLNVPYVGAGVLASSLAMDKAVSKELVSQAGIPTPAFVSFAQSQWQCHQAECLARIQTELAFPVFVKPVRTGSSIGVNKVVSPEDVSIAIEKALVFDHKVIVETGIVGREVEFAVLEGVTPEAETLVSGIGEIISSQAHGFYTYDAKYVDPDGAQIVVNASFPAEQVKEGQRVAKQCFECLRGEGMARVDLFFEEASQQFYFNELNTMPGFTGISMYPMLMNASGVAPDRLLSQLISCAMNRFDRSNSLKRER